MRLYSETFKKSVVKKVLSEGVVMEQVADKLNIRSCTLKEWIKKYRDKVTPEAPDLDAIIEECREKEVNIDLLLEEAGRIRELAESKSLIDVDKILKKEKKPEQYTLHEKLIIVETFYKQPENEKGIWLRNHGLYSQYIQLWEKEIFIMAKQKINESEELRKLREENKQLKKQLKESQRNEKELKILIELKKKYRDLFEESEDD